MARAGPAADGRRPGQQIQHQTHQALVWRRTLEIYGEWEKRPQSRGAAELDFSPVHGRGAGVEVFFVLNSVRQTFEWEQTERAEKLTENLKATILLSSRFYRAASRLPQETGSCPVLPAPPTQALRSQSPSARCAAIGTAETPAAR